jgi:hypothetical protein
MKFIHDCHRYLCNVKVNDKLRHLRTKRRMLKFNEILSYFMELEELSCIIDNEKLSLESKIEVVSELN